MIWRASYPNWSARYRTQATINRKIGTLVETFGLVVPEWYFTDPY